MRRTVRVFAAVGPVERLGRAIAAMPPGVRRTLAQVACRTDLSLASGSWQDDGGGCLVANAVACVGDPADRRTLDLRMLDAFPQMSSRDLNTLIVAWDEAAAQADVTDDAGLRALLHAGLVWADVPLPMPEPDPAAAGSARGGMGVRSSGRARSNWASSRSRGPRRPTAGSGPPAARRG